MSSVVGDTLKTLETASARSKSVLVAYSGGKDSLAVLDLCHRTFERVECFFMYLVPGLECIESALDYGRVRWGVTIHQFPHWLVRKLIVDGVYCRNHYSHDDLPEWKLRDIYDVATASTGIPIIATGAKKADSLWRRRNLTTVKSYTDIIYPIVEWTKLDVLSYLKARAIPLPSSSNRSATGIDLSTPSLLWLHDTYPNDFKKLCEVFPFAEAVVWRRTFYGLS